MIKPEDWRPADDLILEPNAMTAIREVRRNIALTAGPGAGKTEMLAQRADFLLRTGICPYPQRILAISFKVDASHNLHSRVHRRCGRRLAARLDSFTFHAFAKRLIDRFRPALSKLNRLDPDYTVGTQRIDRTQITFDDMVPLAIEILENSDVARAAVFHTYGHVFLDEFQDCTNSQYDMVKLLFRGTGINITAVGDTKQRIMGYAGALEGIFKLFANDFNARGLNLYQNYRSLPRLRRMQNAMVEIMDPSAALPNGAIAGFDGQISVHAFPNSTREADAVASLIDRWINSNNIPPAEIAVLVAKQVEYYAEHLMRRLADRGIPFRNEQRIQDLSVEPISRLIVDFLLVVLGDREPEAYERLMGILVATGIDEDAQYSQRMQWQQFIDDSRKRARLAGVPSPDASKLRKLGNSFLTQIGRDRLVSLSAEYEQGIRLNTLM